MSDANTPVGEIRGVLLPLHGGQLLLPNASVSEVAGYHPPNPVADAPEWLLGLLDWRQYQIPVVSFEALVETGSAQPTKRARLAVCNTLGGNPKRPFIGIVLTSMPHLVKVTEDVIMPMAKPQDLGPAVKREVMINGEEAWIPDLNALEWQVQEALS
jgi:chemosensory pili system protein ChpC